MYNSLTKEEKKQIQKKFNNTKKAGEVLPIFRRLILEGIASIICGIVVILYAILKESIWYYWVIGVTCLTFGIIFLIAQSILKVKQYNMMMKKAKK